MYIDDVSVSLQIQHPGSAASTLVLSESVIPIQSWTSPRSGAHAGVSQATGPDTASAASREAATILAAVTASISRPISGSETDSAGIALLLAQLAGQNAAQLRHMMPGIVAALRSATENCLLSSQAVAQTRLRRILRIIAALAANSNLPVEFSCGELLATTCSILLHKQRVDHSASASSTGQLGVQEQANTRTYAADVLSAVVERSARLWPEVRSQAGNVLLDALAGAVQVAESDGGGAGSGAASASSAASTVGSYESLYGAASGLAALPQIPTDTAIPLAEYLRNALLEQQREQSLRGMGKAPSDGDRQWIAACIEALSKVLKQHGSRGLEEPLGVFGESDLQ